MRSLTEGEAITIRSLLASESISERERTRRSKVPARTFARARRRAYDEGWVFDRYIPDPRRLGMPLCTFALVQPFAEQMASMVQKWGDDPLNILLWRWPEMLLGVFVSEAAEAMTQDRIGASESVRKEFWLTADTRSAQLPVYFDFEGAWSRFIGQEGTLAYPHPLPAIALEGTAPTSFSSAERGKVLSMVSVTTGGSTATKPLRGSPFFLPRSQQRLLSEGAIERRTFLDINKIPPYQDRALESVVFIHGNLAAGATADQLFGRLSAIDVSPFLFVEDGSRILLAALSPNPESQSHRRTGVTVLGNVQQFVNEIEVERLPVSLMTIHANHRYERLLAPSGSVRPRGSRQELPP